MARRAQAEVEVCRLDAARAHDGGVYARSASCAADTFVQGTPSLASARKGAVAWTNRLATCLLSQHRHLMAGLREQGRGK